MKNGDISDLIFGTAIGGLIWANEDFARIAATILLISLIVVSFFVRRDLV